MAFKDVLALALPGKEDQSAIDAAQTLAAAAKGVATVALFEVQLDAFYDASGYIAADVVAAENERIHTEFASTLATLQAAVGPGVRVRAVTTPRSLLGLRAGVNARYADVAVVIQPEDPEHVALAEGALFGAGRPLLVAPRAWGQRPIGRTIVIAWDASREAALAVSAASGLLDAADKIFVVTVDAKPSFSGHGETPGADIAAHLARRGLKVETRNIDGMGRRESTVLLDECRVLGADLLVMGGYGHSRLQQIVLGGVTRDVLKNAALPVMLAH
ncbi:MAG: universal stress protein [Hyphomonadaceae bacterium]